MRKQLIDLTLTGDGAVMVSCLCAGWRVALAIARGLRRNRPFSVLGNPAAYELRMNGE